MDIGDQQDDGVDEGAPVRFQVDDIQHYSIEQIDDLYSNIKKVMRPANKPTPFKEMVETSKQTESKDTRVVATKLFMKSLILAQEGKVKIEQGIMKPNQELTVAFQNLSI